MANEFRVLIKTDNAAFDDNRDLEVARILRGVVADLEQGVSARNLRDVNGNHVGDFGFVIDGTMP